MRYDLLPGVIDEAESIDLIGSLSKSESSEDYHGVVLQNAGVLIAGLGEVGLVSMEGLGLDDLPLVLGEV